MTKATTFGSGALIHLVFDTDNEFKAIFSDSGWFDSKVKKAGLTALLNEKITIETVAFQSSVTAENPVADFVRLHGFRPGDEGKKYSVLGTVLAEDFRKTFKELFS